MSPSGVFENSVACSRSEYSTRRTFSADCSRSPHAYIRRSALLIGTLFRLRSILPLRRHRRLRRLFYSEAVMIRWSGLFMSVDRKPSLAPYNRSRAPYHLSCGFDTCFNKKSTKQVPNPHDRL
ncbi:unnamed protein product [Ixodes pacificus]